MRGQQGLHVVGVVLDVVVFQDRVNAFSLFFVPLFGRVALVVRWLLGSSACCPGGSLLDSMIYSIVFFADASCLFSLFAFALASPYAFGLAVPKAPPCGPPDGGSTCGTVDFALMRDRFCAGD